MRVLLILALLVTGCRATPDDALTLAAASSLRRALPELIAGWGGEATATYGGSGTLRQQVAAGAPADGLIFAGPQHVDALVAQGLAADARTLATNDLVLIAPAGAEAAWTFATMASFPTDRRLALGDPRTVPAGRYAQETLTSLGAWSAISDAVIPASDVAAVLTYVRRGEVDAGVVYGSEVVGLEGVRVLDRHPGATRPAVVGARVVGSERSGDVDAFFAWVAGPEGRAILGRHGFSSP